MVKIIFEDAVILYGKQSYSKEIVLDKGEYDMLLFYPAPFAPSTLNITVADNVRCNHKLCRITDELYALFPSKTALARTPDVIGQYYLGNCLATVYDNGERMLSLEDENKYLTHKLPAKDISISYDYAANDRLYVARAEKYLLIVTYDGDFRVALELKDCETEIYESGLKATRRLSDMLSREVEEYYSYTEEYGYTLTDRKISYKTEHKYIKELICYLFIDSLLAGDYSYARDMLSDDLKEEIEELAKFVKGKTLYISPYIPFDPETVYTIDDENSLRRYSVTVENGKISDIDEEEC